MRNEQVIEKHNAPARVQLSDGSMRSGLIFLRQGQRVLDLLCEQKPFFALRAKTGLVLINKANVAAVELLDREAFKEQQDAFPEFDVEALEYKSW